MLTVSPISKARVQRTRKINEVEYQEYAETERSPTPSGSNDARTRTTAKLTATYSDENIEPKI